MIKILILILGMLLALIVGLCFDYLIQNFNKLPNTGVWCSLLVLEIIIQFCVPILHKKLKI